MSIFDHPFPSAKTTRIFLTDDQRHWIDVKQELTVDEEHRIATAAFDTMSADATDENAVKFGMRWDRVTFARTVINMAAWSINDEKPPREASVRSLKKPVFDAISDKVKEHSDAREAAKKKDEPTTSPTITDSGSEVVSASAG